MTISKSKLWSAMFITTFGLTACGGGGGGDSTPPGNGGAPTVTTNVQMSGAVVDGYLEKAIACLDLNKNNFCELSTEPAATTDAQGRYSFSVTQAQQQHANFSTAPILVFDGQDTDTGKRFSGKLFAPQSLGQKSSNTSGNTENVSVTINVTAITTLVEKTGDAEKVRQALGQGASLDLGVDPIALAKQASTSQEQEVARTVLAQNIALNRSIETLITAAKKDGASEDSQTLTNQTYDALNNVINAQIADNSVSDNNAVAKWVAKLNQATGIPTAMKNTSGVAAITAQKTTDIIEGIPAAQIGNSGAVQDASLKTSSVVTAIDKQINDGAIDVGSSSPDLTAAQNAADQGATTSPQLAYIQNQGVNLESIPENEIDAFNAIDMSSLSGNYTLESIKNFSADVPMSIKTRIEQTISNQEAAENVISSLEAAGITLSDEDKNTLTKLDYSTLNGEYLLPSIANVSGIPVDLKTTIQQTVAAGVTSGKFYYTNNYTGLEGKTINSSIWRGVQNFSSANVSRSGQNLTIQATNSDDIRMGQDIDFNSGYPKPTIDRDLRNDNTSQTFTTTLNSDGSFTINEQAVGETVTKEGGNQVTMVKRIDSNFVPIYKDTVTGQNVYFRARAELTSRTQPVNGYKQAENVIATLIPASNQGVQSNVTGSIYGGIIMATNFPNADVTDLSNKAFFNTIFETSRWNIDPMGNLVRLASEQNRARLKIKAQPGSAVEFDFQGESFEQSNRITRNANIDAPNGNSMLKVTWANSDGSTRNVAFTPDGMFGVINKHHTQYKLSAPGPVYDCTNTTDVPDTPTQLKTCQLGTRYLVKLPNAGSGNTNATIVENLAGKTYEFMIVQTQAGTSLDFIDQTIGTAKVLFSKNDQDGSLDARVQSFEGSTATASMNSGQLSGIDITEDNKTMTPGTMDMVETSDSKTKNRLGEFEIRLTRDGDNGDPAASLPTRGVIMRLFTSADSDIAHGGDSDEAPDIILGAVYEQSEGDDGSTDKSLWMMVGYPE